MLLGVLVQRRLQVERINCHHFDRRGRLKLRRDEDHGGYPTVNRKGEALDQFLVRDHLIFARWQSSINSLQEKGMDEFQRFAVRAHDHRRASAAAGGSHAPHASSGGFPVPDRKVFRLAQLFEVGRRPPPPLKVPV